MRIVKSYELLCNIITSYVCEKGRRKVLQPVRTSSSLFKCISVTYMRKECVEHVGDAFSREGGCLEVWESSGKDNCYFNSSSVSSQLNHLTLIRPKGGPRCRRPVASSLLRRPTCCRRRSPPCCQSRDHPWRAHERFPLSIHTGKQVR